MKFLFSNKFLEVQPDFKIFDNVVITLKGDSLFERQIYRNNKVIDIQSVCEFFLKDRLVLLYMWNKEVICYNIATGEITNLLQNATFNNRLHLDKYIKIEDEVDHCLYLYDLDFLTKIKKVYGFNVLLSFDEGIHVDFYCEEIRAKN